MKDSIQIENLVEQSLLNFMQENHVSAYVMEKALEKTLLIIKDQIIYELTASIPAGQNKKEMNTND